MQPACCACSYVESLIAAEVAAGIPSTRVLLGGFSQGAALSLLAVRASDQLAGVFSLSGYLPLANASVLVSPANLGLPVLMCQGEEDDTVSHFSTTNCTVSACLSGACYPIISAQTGAFPSSCISPELKLILWFTST